MVEKNFRYCISRSFIWHLRESSVEIRATLHINTIPVNATHRESDRERGVGGMRRALLVYRVCISELSLQYYRRSRDAPGFQVDSSGDGGAGRARVAW